MEGLHAAANAKGRSVDPNAWLFSTTEGQSGALTGRPMSQPDTYRMISRRAADAGHPDQDQFATPSARQASLNICVNGGKLEVAQQMANHESARTTGL